MEEFEISIKTTDVKGKAETKIKGSRISIMNGLANLVSTLKKQSLLSEEDIEIAVQAGIKDLKDINVSDKDFDELIKHILSI